MDNAVLRAKVDEYVKWDNLLNAAKKEIELLKADLQKEAVTRMKDTKVKQIVFWGSGNSKVVITTSETLKLVSHQFLLRVIGADLLKDFVREETQYKLSEPFKRIMTAILQGAYVEQTVDDVLAQIDTDDKARKTLRKKVKGNWEKDIEHLKNIAGLEQKEAEHFAFFIQEAKNYEAIVNLMEAAGYKTGGEDFQKALDSLRHAAIVDEGLKIGLETGDKE